MMEPVVSSWQLLSVDAVVFRSCVLPIIEGCQWVMKENTYSSVDMNLETSMERALFRG